MQASNYPLRFLRHGQWTELASVDPNRTLLDHIRAAKPAGLGCQGTKEGCAQGDCGACAVLIGELTPDTNELRLRAVNACIKPLSSIDGCALWTVEDLVDSQGLLHPVQAAMVKFHGSQCGFCTPGFVMSLVALYETSRLSKPPAQPMNREAVLEAISGNLCRCTGYAPIVNAALSLSAQAPQPTTHSGLIDQAGRDALLAALKSRAALRPFRPRSLNGMLKLRAKYPQAQMFAGATDVGLWINKQHRRFEETIDLGAVKSLQKIEVKRAQLTIGATARLTEAFEALCRDWPQLRTFTSRFAGLTVRNSATLGGNIANGSPIGDSMPLLIAMGATLRLHSVRAVREMPIEDFFLGFRRTALQADEILGAILIPRGSGARLRAYKVSKRFEDDISAVCLAISIEVDADGTIVATRIGVGGVAATPVRALVTEQVLIGQRWTQASLERAAQSLMTEFNPISDLRASATYRSEVLAALMRRFWLEENGQSLALEDIRPIASSP